MTHARERFFPSSTSFGVDFSLLASTGTVCVPLVGIEYRIFKNIILKTRSHQSTP